jgi:hypothetical protein
MTVDIPERSTAQPTVIDRRYKRISRVAYGHSFPSCTWERTCLRSCTSSHCGKIAMMMAVMKMFTRASSKKKIQPSRIN